MLGLGLTAQDSARLAVGGGTNSGPAAAVPAKVENVSFVFKETRYCKWRH